MPFLVLLLLAFGELLLAALFLLLFLLLSLQLLLHRSLQIFTVLMVHAARTRKRSRWQKISKTLLRDSFAGSWDRPGTGYHMVGFGSKHRSTDAVFVWPCSSSTALCHLNGSTEGWRPFGL